MIAIIRIRGEVNVTEDVEETFNRLRLRKKFSCVVVPETEENKGRIKKVKNFIAYGKVDNATLEQLIEKRGKSKKKIDVKKVAGEMEKGKIESIKPFFRLHPPRGGIDSKIHYPKGVLGDNKEEINDLIRRML